MDEKSRLLLEFQAFRASPGPSTDTSHFPLFEPRQYRMNIRYALFFNKLEVTAQSAENRSFPIT